jgi:hypothetical protein
MILLNVMIQRLLSQQFFWRRPVGIVNGTMIAGWGGALHTRVTEKVTKPGVSSVSVERTQVTKLHILSEDGMYIVGSH